MTRGFVLAGLALIAAFTVRQEPKPSGVALSDLFWPDAQTALTDSSVVVIPLGLGAAEEGPHMRLNSGERLARYLASRVQSAPAVAVAPAMPYHFSPAFAEYPGSASLSRTVARDMTVEIVRSYAKYGPRRFYVLNTAATSVAPLSAAAQVLANDGILLGYTDPRYYLSRAAATLRQRTAGDAAHADEIDTSIMLYVDPTAVDMTKAVAEYGGGTGTVLTRKEGASGVYSASGVVGDPTAATKEKGRALVDALVNGALDDIDKLRTAPLPTPKPAPPPPPAPPRPAPQPTVDRLTGCTLGEEREIRQIGPRFSAYWSQEDVVGMMTLFTPDADMRHPDGYVERTTDVIAQNRIALFQKREYRDSVHPVTLTDIRCLNRTVAIADGKWELRFVHAPDSSTPASAQQRYAGLCTLVMMKAGEAWKITAWRYTVTPEDGPPPPTVLKQPGFLTGRGRGD